MHIMEKYFARLKKKSKWSWASDIIFGLLIIALIVPATRTPLIVLVKRATLFSPSISVKDNFGELNEIDLQWALINENDQLIRLSDLKDKPVFINIWASWCAPCIAEMPSIDKLYADYKDKVHFVIATYETKNLVNSFLLKHDLSFPVYRYQTKEPELLQSKTIPATFIINTKGQIVVSEKGTSNWNSNKVRNLLDNLISGEQE
ncbi:MAG: TlpA disulfide reductase family protein [Bacteroidota bacterium]